MKIAAISIYLILLWHSLAMGGSPGTLVVAQGVDATTLDPHNQNDTPTANISLNINETLLQMSSDLKIKPLLATSYQRVNDTTWEFHLRKEVKFHNGEEFNAASVKFSLERLADPKNKLKMTMFHIIERVDIIDDYTVRIIHKEPNPLLEKGLCIAGSMLPPIYFREKGPGHFALNPVGTGPYKFIRWMKDDHILLEANEKYWRGAPKISKVIFRPIPEPTTRVAGLQNQELDIVVNIPPNLTGLMDWKGRSLVSKVPSMRAIYVAFDTTKGGPVADKRVRQGIAQAVNMESIIKHVLGGNGVSLAMNFTKEQFGFDPSIQPYSYNPDQARKLLREAGYPHGFDFVLHAPVGRYLNDKEIAEAIAGDLRKVGINATARLYQFGTFVSRWTSHNVYPAYLAGWGHPLFDAAGTMYPTLRSGEPFSNYSNPNLDALVTRARTMMDEKERQRIYFDACKIIKEEVPVCLCYQQIDIYGINERVNWKPRPDERLYVFEMSLKK